MNITDTKIGILAVTAEGAAKTYRDMHIAFYDKFGAYNNPTITMTMHPLIDHVNNFGDKNKWVLLIQKGIDDLIDQNVDLICMPANSSHLVIDEIDFKDVPFINMVEEAVNHLKNTTKNTLILGTKISLSESLYLKNLPANCFVPKTDDIEKLNEIIVKEMVLGKLSETSRSFILNMIEENQKAHNIEHLFFACTELPCFFNNRDLPLPTLDSIQLLIKKVLTQCLET